tara:strand:+ start:924 stop:1544 length:621 start_codon:yes stop_codon:yes gene_type:complete
MADTLTEIENVRGSMGRPIAGQSLTNDPENPAPFEQAPQFTDVHDALEYLWSRFIEPEAYQNILAAVADGTPVMDLVQVTLYHGFTEGMWNPDLMLMLAEPATYMIMALAERQDIPMTIYNGELEDETDEEMLFGKTLSDDKIKRLKRSKESGTIPKGILTSEMEQDLENVEDLDIPPPVDSLMARPERPVTDQQSLMAAPNGANQ